MRPACAQVKRECEEPQQATELIALSTGQFAVQVLFCIASGGLRSLEQREPLRGGDHNVGPTIARIGLAPHEAACLQIVDERHDLTRIETQELGEFALRRAGVAGGKCEHGVGARAQPVLRERRVAGRERERVRARQQKTEVVGDHGVAQAFGGGIQRGGRPRVVRLLRHEAMVAKHWNLNH